MNVSRRVQFVTFGGSVSMDFLLFVLLVVWILTCMLCFSRSLLGLVIVPLSSLKQSESLLAFGVSRRDMLNRRRLHPCFKVSLL